MEKYEIKRDPHTGVFYINLNEQITLYFAPQSAKELSGWSLILNGESLLCHDGWQYATHQQIVYDLKELRTTIEKWIGKDDATEVTAKVIVAIMQEAE